MKPAARTQRGVGGSRAREFRVQCESANGDWSLGSALNSQAHGRAVGLSSSFTIASITYGSNSVRNLSDTLSPHVNPEATAFAAPSPDQRARLVGRGL
jgi:hypothetical protein